MLGCCEFSRDLVVVAAELPKDHVCRAQVFERPFYLVLWQVRARRHVGPSRRLGAGARAELQHAALHRLAHDRLDAIHARQRLAAEGLGRCGVGDEGGRAVPRTCGDQGITIGADREVLARVREVRGKPLCPQRLPPLRGDIGSRHAEHAICLSPIDGVARACAVAPHFQSSLEREPRELLVADAALEHPTLDGHEVQRL
mmetsp:Transcript_104033/g.279425  ORF Transcript_104033/g.279425 Transcript_104033/m.279425 type:complete len:200 (-) Transcript_104033:1157-1756(-)